LRRTVSVDDLAHDDSLDSAKADYAAETSEKQDLPDMLTCTEYCGNDPGTYQDKSGQVPMRHMLDCQDMLSLVSCSYLSRYTRQHTKCIIATSVNA
jgi:hypothetical protein